MSDNKNTLNESEIISLIAKTEMAIEDYLHERDSYDIGQNIRRIRKAKNITQGELATKINVSRQNLSQYETGKRIPKISTLQKIADGLQCSIYNLDPLFDDYDKIVPFVNVAIHALYDYVFSALNKKGLSTLLSVTESLAKNPNCIKNEMYNTNDFNELYESLKTELKHEKML